MNERICRIGGILFLKINKANRKKININIPATLFKDFFISFKSSFNMSIPITIKGTASTASSKKRYIANLN
jgi:hypothetical protein